MVSTGKTNKSAIGENILLACKRLAMRPPDFADHVGVKWPTLRDLIYGKTDGIAESVRTVAKALECEPWELLRPAIGEDERHRPDEKALRKTNSKTHPFGAQGKNDDSDPTGDSESREKLHAMSSVIADKVVTALESRLLPEPLSEEEQILIKAFRQASDHGQAAVLYTATHEQKYFQRFRKLQELLVDKAAAKRRSEALKLTASSLDDQAK